MADYYDIGIRIGRRRRSGDQFPVRIILADGRQATGWFKYPEVPGGITLEMELAQSLFRDEVLALALDGVDEARKTSYGGRILLEITVPELYRLPWEAVLKYYPFNVATPFELIRFSPYLAELALVPFTLPIDVLIARLEGVGEIPWHSVDLPSEPLQYFRATVVSGLTGQDLGSLLGGRQFAVIHLQGHGHWRENGEGMLGPATGDEALDCSRLRVLLKKSHTRLLVLEACGPDYEPLLDLGHRLLGPFGPMVLVVSSQGFPSPTTPFFTELYYGIVHDEPLDRAVAEARRRGKVYCAIIQAKDGENLLRLSRITPHLLGQVQLQLKRAREATADMTLRGTSSIMWPGIPRPKEFGLSQRLEERLPHLETALQQTYSFLHEKGGMVPQTETSRLLKETKKEIEEESKSSDRVVNTWFESGARTIRIDESLEAGKKYQFHLQIGVRSEKSIVVGPKAIPEKELERFYSKEGLDLRVILFSDDFTIEEPERRLRLPKPPEETRVLKFPVAAPTRIGHATMRACIYYKQNLLQSLLVTATITAESRARLARGNQAELEFAMSGSLRDIERFPERSLNILINEKVDGTHTFAVVGPTLATKFNLTEGEMRTKIDYARKTLQSICSTLDSKGKPDKYRFEPDNRGREKEFVADLKQLAEYGYDLYVDLVTSKNRDFEDKLRRALGSSATIQISVMKSAKYIFPWSLVYDKDLTVSDDNVVCENFLQLLRKGGPPGFLGPQVCLDIRCPYQDDTNIVCPWGFWGFKHTVEQPLSAPQEDGEDGQRGKTDLKLEIKVDKNLSFLMGVSETLKHLDAHIGEIKAFVTPDVRNSRQQIGLGLKHTDLHIVYFYCHGGRTGGKTWLGVGKKEKLYPGDLKAWHIMWPVSHPLVFINGCHTVDMTPDDLLHFNKMLSYCWASGVIGTEIIIPETLARHFAKGFLEDFLRGEKIGEVIKRQRLLLLERYNLLGLVYTPYCSADLQVIQQT